jgi:hypothetical protein
MRCQPIFNGSEIFLESFVVSQVIAYCAMRHAPKILVANGNYSNNMLSLVLSSWYPTRKGCFPTPHDR